MEIKKIKVNELQEHPRNKEFFRNMVGLEWQNFLDDVKEVGIKNPIIIDQNNFVVSGNQRLRACIELGIDTIDCIISNYENEQEEISDLIRFNVIQRNLNLFDTLELINKVKQNYKSRQGVRNDLSLTSANSSPKLLQPREQIAKDLGVTDKIITLANKYEQLTVDEVNYILEKNKDKIITQKLLSSEINTLIKEKDNQLEKFKIEVESKQILIQNLEKEKNEIKENIYTEAQEKAQQGILKTLDRFEQERKSIKEKLDEKTLSLNELTQEIVGLRGNNIFYKEMKAKEDEINETYKKIAELKTRQSKLFEDTESLYFLRKTFKEVKEFTATHIIEVGTVNISESSKEFMQPEFKEFIEIIRNWVSFIEEKFIIKVEV